MKTGEISDSGSVHTWESSEILFVLCQWWIKDYVCYMNTLLIICTSAVGGTCTTKVIEQILECSKQQYFPFSLQVSLVALLSLLQRVQMIWSYPSQISICIQSQASTSFTIMPLTHLHSTLDLSVDSPKFHAKSFLSPTSLPVLEIPISPLFRIQPLASVEPKWRKFTDLGK